MLFRSLLVGFGMTEPNARLFKWGSTRATTSWTLEVPDGDHLIEIFERGRSVDIRPESVMIHEYFGRVLMREYSIEAPVGDMAVFIDGKPIPLASSKPCVLGDPGLNRFAELTERCREVMLRQTSRDKMIERFEVEAGIRSVGRATLACQKLINRLKSHAEDPTTLTSVSKADVESVIATVGNSFDNCWIILDRPHKADDNGEHLYRYIKDKCQDINAFFLLREDSPDWSRLEEEGFRLLAYGSPEGIAAASRAAVVISSDAVGECMHLIPKALGIKAKYKFVFLQHGVTINDISDWLNYKAIDLCVAVTRSEYDVFVWKESKYLFKAANVALTGFPRFDALLMKARVHDSKVKSGAACLLVMPTWRRSLKLSLDAAISDEERREILRESTFIKSWLSLVASPVLKALVDDGKLRVRFVAHPNLVEFQHLLDHPDWIEFVDPTKQSFQDLIVEADLFLTDYSSLG